MGAWRRVAIRTAEHLGETKAQKHEDPPEAGRCPGKPGRSERLATQILPENQVLRKPDFSGNGIALSKTSARLRRAHHPKDDAYLWNSLIILPQSLAAAAPGDDAV